MIVMAGLVLVPTALLVVFPGLAMQPETMIASMAGFSGQQVIVVADSDTPASRLPAALQDAVDSLKTRAVIRTIASRMFGNRRGLLLPVDVALGIARDAALDPATDILLLTGCYRGWLPGSIDVLAEAFAALHFKMKVDAAVMKR